MIQTETITIGSRQLIRTYSDAGMKIERDGIRYDEAVDPISMGRTYTETDEPVEQIAEETGADLMREVDNTPQRVV